MPVHLLQFSFYQFLLSKCICECSYGFGTNTDRGRDIQKQLWAGKWSPDLDLTQYPQVSDSRRGCGWNLLIQTTFSSNQSHQDFSSLDNQQEGLYTQSWLLLICNVTKLTSGGTIISAQAYWASSLANSTTNTNQSFTQCHLPSRSMFFSIKEEHNHVCAIRWRKVERKPNCFLLLF